MSTGIGPFPFGSGEAETIAGLSAVLGDSSIDESATYVEMTDWGAYLDPESQVAFASPVGRTVCWPNAFCAHFGGDRPALMTLAGWTQGPEPEGMPLATPDGITVGTSVADHVGAIEVPEGGCYSQSFGSAHGISVSLWSDGVPFSEYSDDGTEVRRAPPADDLTVTYLQAGDAPYDAYMDC